MKKTLSFILCFFIISNSAFAWKNQFIADLKNGGAYVIDNKGKVLLKHRETEGFIPASTVKIATAAAALHYLGDDSRFITEFYLTKDDQLVVKGYGDPGLVSEEIQKIANTLKKKGLKKIKGLILDDSYFQDDIEVDGRGESLRAYDAVNGALVANFNTIFVKKLSGGKVISAEKQTPLTSIAEAKVKGLKPGRYRINIGRDTEKTAKYFGEILTVFLQRAGVQVAGDMRIGVVPSRSKLFYKHRSTKTVAKVVQEMLEYSTNFTANQLLLMIGSLEKGDPATIKKGVIALNEFLQKKVGWKDFVLVEGSGLSRKNSISPKTMIQLLEHFKDHKNLLHLKDGVFRAKTGTLTNVNTYAGFFDTPDGRTVQFVFFVNDTVPFDYKFEMARKLYRGIVGHDVPTKEANIYKGEIPGS